MNDYPQNLLDATRYFADPDACVAFMAAMLWPDGVVCPHCQAKTVSYLRTRRIWKCMAKECHKQFSAKTGTVFEDSPLPLDKWLIAVWLIVNCKNGVSSYEIARDLKVTQKSAWFMLHRIRLALRGGTWAKLGGNGGAVESDETYIGGAPKNRHGHNPKERAKYIRDDKGKWNLNPNYAPLSGRATKKIPVMGMLDRETREVRAKVIPHVDRRVLQEAILQNVSPGSKIYTDSLPEYKNLKNLDFVHEAVNHVNEYVRGEVHTNGLENFWSLLKRGLRGTYVAVEPFHLERYVDEQVFRFNNRATKTNPLNDADRFILAVSQVAGKRLTYKELTGKVGETAF